MTTTDIAQQQHILTEVNARLAKANSECEAWLAARSIERYLEACSKAEAIEMQRAIIVRDAAHAAHNATHVPDRAERMADLSIAYDGCRFYYYDTYRYDKLEFAVDYALLQRARAGPTRRKIPTPTPPKSNEPSESDRELMQSEGVTFVSGVYALGDHRYDKLGDALAYARVMRAHRVARQEP